MKILCLTPVKHLDGIYGYLEKFGTVDYFPDLNERDFFDLSMNEYDVLFCNPNKQNYRLNSATLQNFKGVILTASTGLNHIDVEYCKNNDIRILSHTKDYELLNELPSTAELAFGLMLSLMRNIPRGLDDVKHGGWDYEKFMGHQLYKKTIGIIGHGRLGKMMHNYCSAFGMDVKIYDPYKGYYNLDSLLNFSDVISLTYCKTLCCFNHSRTNSIPVLPLTKGLEGFAFAVKMIIVYVCDNSLIASKEPGNGSP